MSKTKTDKMNGTHVDDTDAGSPESQRATNMRLWDRVCTTDPANTKHVNARGGFTAIDAYSQIQRATEVFGPMGIGWGYHVQCEIDSTGKDTLVIARFELWYTESGQRSSPIQTFGAAKFDHDGHKKAITDAMTKALSYLGFNADIFQGKGALGFKDNKYVNDGASPPPPQDPRDGERSQSQGCLVPPEQPQPGTGAEISEPQRKAVYAIASKLWGADGYKAGIKEVCTGLGFDPKALTKKHASAVINKLKQLNGEETGDGNQRGSDDVPF